jgi:hypothetical protein
LFVFSSFTTYASTFKDIPADAWYLDYVEQLVDYGVIEASSDKFRPQDYLNRAELVKMVITAKDNLAYYTAPEKPSFKDVAPEAWYYDYVESAYQLKIVNGYKDEQGNETGFFGPDNHVTRAEAAKILVNNFGVPQKTDPPNGFTDVHAGDWFTEFVTIAFNNGLVQGYPGNLFRPQSPITRAEMAKMLVKALEFNVE